MSGPWPNPSCNAIPVVALSIPGATNRYMATTRGEIHALNRRSGVWSVLRQFDRKLANGKLSGYLSVCLTHDDGVRKNRYVHELVLCTFVGPRPSSKHEALHGDGCRANNWLYNLRWGTVQENADDRERHGGVHRGDAWYRVRGLPPPWVVAESERDENITQPREPAHAFEDLL